MNKTQKKAIKDNDLEDVMVGAYNQGAKNAHLQPSRETTQMFVSLNSKLGEIYDCLFGIKDYGGLINDVKDIKREISNISVKFVEAREFNELKSTVNEHEKTIKSYLGDRKWLLGFIACIILLQSGITYFAKSYITNEIEESVRSVLANYNITYEY